ncbi:MAG: methyltransferase domain-containing protein [Gammaproteobacteria bacterium]|nr:methyltransferase domain-containing protein [Gammaproteobacteria bacterium]
MYQQKWNAQTYQRNARFVSDLATPVVDLLNPQPLERILDLGCGDGVLTAALAGMGCEVVGVDASAEFVAAARERGLDARQVDATALDFAQAFDAVFSNAVLHWIPAAEKVIAGVYNALKPGGRFVAECGGKHCVQQIRYALLEELKRRGLDEHGADPWYFPSVGDYAAKLTAGGFDVRYIELIPRPTRLPGDISGFLETFAGSFLARVPLAERGGYINDVRARLAPLLVGADGVWTADYTRLRFAAIKQE